VANPFDNDELSFFVLVNDENQHSLWPSAIDVPQGWKIALGPDSRRECVKYVDANWTDMRPASLVRQMAGD
jgi:uncharacterized protein YbdZ (MbtH family)